MYVSVRRERQTQEKGNRYTLKKDYEEVSMPANIGVADTFCGEIRGLLESDAMILLVQ